ncbi:MAG: beta-ketoacyl-ACP synthase 3, partial [Bdellovibrionales bacterium]|nr:beta-ketoacyl-ACP synthase 3 [Bdellovibrionales bacterium]
IASHLLLICFTWLSRMNSPLSLAGACSCCVSLRAAGWRGGAFCCRDVMAFDLNAACSGFVYGLSVADQFIRTGHYKTILVVGAEILHHKVNYEDRGTCILFGDGAGAAVVARAPEGAQSYILSSHAHADGSLANLLYVPSGGSVEPFTQRSIDEKRHFVVMEGREIFKHAVRTMSRVCTEALEANNITIDEVDWIIPHQANTRIIEAVAKHLGVSMDKVIVNIEHMGNTSAATCPVAFNQALHSGKIKKGDLVLFTAFGAGLTSGSVLMRY